MNVHGSLAGSTLRASEDHPIEREWPRTALAAPSEDNGVRITQLSSGGSENVPCLVEERWRRPQNLDLPLGPEPHARIPGRTESTTVLDQGQCLRVDFARDQDGVGGPGRRPSFPVEHVGPGEERVEEARVRDSHGVTCTGTDRDGDSPSGRRLRRSVGPSDPGGDPVDERVQSGRRPPRQSRLTRDHLCGRGGQVRFPSVGPSQACVYMM